MVRLGWHTIYGHACFVQDVILSGRHFAVIKKKKSSIYHMVSEVGSWEDTGSSRWNILKRIRTHIATSSSRETHKIQLLRAFTSNMTDRFKPPSMGWTTPGDIHKRFKLFQQNGELIFEWPLDKVEEAKKVTLLLLWIDDKGLEIYNTTTWASDGDNLKIDPVMAALEAYTKPQSNQILVRYQLRCLEQGDRALEE